MNNNFYKLIPGTFGSTQIFAKVFGTNTKSHWVELNCGFGKTSCYLATKIKVLNKDIQLDCIDTFDFELTSEQSKLVKKRGGTRYSTFKRFVFKL